ncbi:hypothetical protein [Ascidiimonas aurantiaca]|uniref:hypothetical protein n=1 Tax=Ascidiimonas aurantiaca TaxID=1685432 RepID=UPI0030ED2B23
MESNCIYATAVKKKSCVLILFLGSLFLTSCTNYGQLTYTCKLPKELKENSGISVSQQENLFWFIADSGNEDHLYGVNTEGTLLKDFNIKNADNQDWEDLARDQEGNIYIGDIGNNRNKRKDLVIYKVPNPDLYTGKNLEAEEIKFNYPEQKEFPPDKKDRLFDAEAFFYSQGFLYIFTKNRTQPFTGETLLYKIPATPGNHKAKLVGKKVLCTDRKSCSVTSADISPDGKKVVLLAHDRIWVLTHFTNDRFLEGTIDEIHLGHYSQKESLCFTNDNTLYISDEQFGVQGRNVYTFYLSKY